MKNHISHRLRFTAPWALSIICAIALLFNGCATQEQVAAIVAQSNAAMVAGQLGELPQASGAKTESWRPANEQIEAFVAAHAGQPGITAPLRVRQALLLLAHQQISLAQAAFDAVAENDLHTDRDRALKQNAAHLVWWFSRSTNSTWSADDQESARRALAGLGKTQDSLSRSPEIRDYLAEMRAWIGLAAAKQSGNPDAARARLVDALDVYAQTFSEHDLMILKQGSEQLPDLKALNSDVRRRLRARALLDAAQQQNKRDELNAHPANATFDVVINRA